MQGENVEVPDVVSAAIVATWSTQVHAAEADLSARQARLQQLDAVLGTAAVGTLRNRLQAAAAALTAAKQRADAAAQQLQAAESASLDFMRTTYTAAEDALAAATQEVADELARLMSAATTSAAVTATVDGLTLRARYRAAIATTPPSRTPPPSRSGPPQRMLRPSRRSVSRSSVTATTPPC